MVAYFQQATAMLLRVTAPCPARPVKALLVEQTSFSGGNGGPCPRSALRERALSPNDQPGVAARVAWIGSGAVVPLKRASVPRLRGCHRAGVGRPSYRQNAQRLQQAIASSGGVARAADIVEQAINTGQQVL
jgi:hypothetical protein